MTNTETTEEDALRKVTPMLRVLQGGKGSSGGGINWLNALRKGTAFSCKSQNDKSEKLEVYIIAFKYDRTVVLVDGFRNDHRFAVDPEVFCKRYNWWETIGQEEDVSPEGDSNGSSRTVHQGTLADDAGLEEGQPEPVSD